jgi:membrane protease YdiL (CAAX protease family)
VEQPDIPQVRVPAWLAALQVFVISGIPTQIVVAAVLMLGLRLDPFGSDGLMTSMSLEFIATLMLVDTALVAILIRVFLEVSGEDSRTVFIGRRKVFGEILRGLAFVPVVFAGVTGIILFLRAVAPWLHTVKESPILQFMQTPFEAAIFLVVVVLGGGVKEELQRGFVLHRFRQSLGGVRLGLTLFSALFGILHFDQGWDVAVALALLGLFWGVAFVQRRSVVLSMTNHATFNAIQVGQVMLARHLGL